MTNVQIGHDITAKVRTADVSLEKNISFKDLFLSPNVLSGLNKAGFHRPSPIQLNAIPFGRCGLDLIVQAKSGTGKTCVFSVIALEAVIPDTSALQSIILAPTREIAVQITGVLEAIGQDVEGLVVACFIGGRPVSDDKITAKGCHIAIGTPGRIYQLLDMGILSCQNVRLFVLDEADKLLEDNFQSQINSIYSILPMNKQMIAASATYPEELAQFVTNYMQDPTFVRLNPKDMALIGIKQYIYEIPRPNDKFLSEFECKIKATVDLLEAYTFSQALVFSNYHSHAKDLSDACNSVGLSATFISGNLEQAKRLAAIQLLKEYKCKVLISTDLTSRGIDASNVDLVVNLDVPHDWETYMHRTGRAGRFGSLGAVISIVMEGPEKTEMLKITSTCNVTLYPITCTGRSISVSTEPLHHDPHKNEDSTFQKVHGFHGKNQRRNNKRSSKNGSHLKEVSDRAGAVSSVIDVASEKWSDNTGMNSNRVPHEKQASDHAVMRDVGVSQISSHNEARSCPNAPKIPSLPELMRRETAQPKQSSFSYYALLENYSFFKDHGVLKDFERLAVSSTNLTCNQIDDIDKHDEDVPYVNSDGLSHCDLTSFHRSEPKKFRNGHLETPPHSATSVKPITSPPIPVKGPSKTRVDKGCVKSAAITTTFMTKISNFSDTKCLSRSKKKKGNREESRNDFGLHSMPMLLPKCSDSSPTVLPNVGCSNCYSMFGRQLAANCQSYQYMYMLWWNQYIYNQYWFSKTFR